MKRLLVVLFGVLVFQGSVWAKCGDPVDEESAKFLSPGQDSVLIKGAPFVVQWQDDAKYLCKKVKIELIEVSGNKKTKVIAKHVDNVGYFTLDKLMASVKDKTSVEKSGDRTKFEYQFRISSIKKACKGVACKILSKPFTLANAELAIYREAHGKGSQRDEAVVLVTNEVRDALVRLTALEERLAELSGEDGSVTTIVKNTDGIGDLEANLAALDTRVSADLDHLRDQLTSSDVLLRITALEQQTDEEARGTVSGTDNGKAVRAWSTGLEDPEDGLPRWNRTPYSDAVSAGTADASDMNETLAAWSGKSLACPQEGCPTRYNLCDFSSAKAQRICQEQADALAGPGMSWGRSDLDLDHSESKRHKKALGWMRLWVESCIAEKGPSVNKKAGCLTARDNLMKAAMREWSHVECRVLREELYEHGDHRVRGVLHSTVPEDCLGLGLQPFLRAECTDWPGRGMVCNHYDWDPQKQIWYISAAASEPKTGWLTGHTRLIKVEYDKGELQPCYAECDPPPYNKWACVSVGTYDICPTGLMHDKVEPCAMGGACSFAY